MSTALHLGKYRVQGQKGYLEVYRQLKGTCFNEYHSLFTLCVFLGYRHGGPKQNRRGKEPLFWSDTFTHYEYAAFYSLFIKIDDDADYSLIKNGPKALEKLQDYADYGMDTLLQSEVLKRYVTEKDGSIILDFGPNDYLPKQIMYYIFNEYSTIGID